eukprot:6309211-Ditylum_brightwellii.AAC.1
MSIVLNLQKHFKTKDAESGSSVDTQVIPFISKEFTLKLDNMQKFCLCVSPTQKYITYKFNAYTDLVEVILEGEASMHWLEFKYVQAMPPSNNLDISNTALL